MIAVFRSLPKIHDEDENGDKNCFENWELCLFWQFSFHDNRIVQSSHYCSGLAYSGIQLFVLPSVTRKCKPRYLNFSTCFSVAPFTCNTHWSGFLERWSTSVFVVLIFIPAVPHSSAKSFNARWRTDSVEEAKPNHQRIADDWFCNSQSWHTHQLGCICRSNSWKQWKGDMGVGALKDLGGHQTFARKMILNFVGKAINFSVQIKVTTKKKKGLHWNWDGFSVWI